MGSSTVFSAWDGDRLVGLVRVLDDTEMVAYMHYVLVDPEYQGHGIADHLVGMVKERYRDYLYIEVMPEESKNATFYRGMINGAVQKDGHMAIVPSRCLDGLSHFRMISHKNQIARF